MSIAPALVQLATFVRKIEDGGTHVIDAQVDHNGRARAAVRGNVETLSNIQELADSIVEHTRYVGEIDAPLLKTSVTVDGIVIDLLAVSAVTRPWLPESVRG